MKSLSPTLLPLSALAVLLALPAGESARSDDAAAPQKLLRHVVLFNFKDEAAAEQVEAVVTAFGHLPDKIDVIQDYEWGMNNSPEGLSKGYTHCFLVSFKSEEDRDAYLPHPEHQAFVQVLKPVLEDVLVIDYWAHE